LVTDRPVSTFLDKSILTFGTADLNLALAAWNTNLLTALRAFKYFICSISGIICGISLLVLIIILLTVGISGTVLPAEFPKEFILNSQELLVFSGSCTVILTEGSKDAYNQDSHFHP